MLTKTGSFKFEYSIDSLYKYIVYQIGGRKYQNWYLYLRGHQILDSTIPSAEPWLSMLADIFDLQTHNAPLARRLC